MLRRFRKRAESPPDSVAARRFAVATLLVEIARADFEVDASERAAIRRMLGSAYGLEADSAGDLVTQAERAVEESVSLYEFTRRLNDELTRAEKGEIMEMLWRVAFADGRIDKYEEHLVRKAADLLHVPHRLFIRARLKVEEESSPDEPSDAPASR